HRLCHRYKIIDLQAKGADWVFRVCIKARTNQHQLRSNLFGRLVEGIFEASSILVARRTERNRFVPSKTQPSTCSRFAGRSGTRIKRIAMNRKEHYARVGIENVLGTVAVVHVPIDDEDSIEFVPSDGVLRCNRDVIEQTKAHGLVRS